MKRLLSCLLCFVLLASSSILVSAEGFTTASGVTPQLIEREQQLLEQIENNLDLIHAQIEEYQKNYIPQIRGVSYGGFQYLDGDILVTKSTSSAGLTGHAGIIVGTKVLEITPAYNGGVPATISLSTWYTRYPSTIVVRYKVNRTVPVNAAWYGQTFYIDGDGNDNTYSLTSSMTSLTKDYCSSLVWKCYHFGAGFDYKISDLGSWYVPSPFLPYYFITDLYMTFNQFEAVHSVNW